MKVSAPLIGPPMGSSKAWSKAPADQSAQQASWAVLSEARLADRMTSFRLLVHSVASDLPADRAVAEAFDRSPRRMTSLSLVTERRCDLFFGQKVGFVFVAPPAAIVATSPTDFASSTSVDDAPEMYARRGIHSPEALLSSTEAGTWNEVLTVTSGLRPTAVFLIDGADAGERGQAAALARRAKLPLVTLVPKP